MGFYESEFASLLTFAHWSLVYRDFYERFRDFELYDSTSYCISYVLVSEL